MQDWVTPVAQVVNFLVLVWLLRRFLYGPIVRVMDERQERVTSELREAKAREQAAEELGTKLEQDRAEFEASREQVLAKAHAEAHAEALRIHEEARAEADAARKRWHESLSREEADVLSAVRRRLAKEIGAVSIAALRDLADDDLQRRAIAVFTRKLAALSDADAKSLAKEARREGALTVRCACEADAETREQVTRALRERLGELPETRWVDDDELGFGLRVETNGRELGWSATDYLEGVGERLQATLEQRTEPQG
jgi:F-type H+-transporting ATPase subunit b